jgi:hypothetical protein
MEPASSNIPSVSTGYVYTCTWPCINVHVALYRTLALSQRRMRGLSGVEGAGGEGTNSNSNLQWPKVSKQRPRWDFQMRKIEAKIS